MPLTGHAQRPPTCLNSMNDGGPYCNHGRLKSFEVSRRPHPVHCFAVRTSNQPYPNPRHEPVEEALYKTVKPEPCTTTPGTGIRPGPGKISPLPKNTTEGNAYGQYHAITSWRVYSGPYMLRAEAPPSHRPLHTTAEGRDPASHPFTVKNSLCCPPYSEKSFAFLSIEFEGLQPPKLGRGFRPPKVPSKSFRLQCILGKSSTKGRGIVGG